MRKFLFALLLPLILTSAVFTAGKAFAADKFTEGIDYTVSFDVNETSKPAVLHVNFTAIVPENSEAESVLRKKLVFFGKKQNKNVIGSVWYPENNAQSKVKFKDGVSSLVWISKSGRIVPFPEYINMLKNNKIIDRDKAIAKQREAQQSAQDTQIYQEGNQGIDQ